MVPEYVHYDKIIESFMDDYEDLPDTVSFDEFCRILCDKYQFVLGTIYNIEEFE